jgi:hypothetical protein
MHIIQKENNIATYMQLIIMIHSQFWRESWEHWKIDMAEILANQLHDAMDAKYINPVRPW